MPTANIALMKRHYYHSSRRAVCTHIRASRLFDEKAVCYHCRRPGDQGWIYRCTQDSDGRIPLYQSGLNAEQQERLTILARNHGWNLPGLAPSYSERLSKAEDNIREISSLKPWMIKAISSDKYTPEQIAKLIIQRMHVKDTIMADEMQVELTEQNKLSLDAGPKPKLMRMPIHDRSIHVIGHDGQRENNPGGSVSTVSSEGTLKAHPEAHKKVAPCDYQCCSKCR